MKGYPAADHMLVAVKCINCNWVGNAKVDRRKKSRSPYEQQCPECGSDIKRRTGRVNWRDEYLNLRK